MRGIRWIAFLLFIPLVFSSVSAWYDLDTFPYRQELTISNYSVDNNLTDFTVVLTEDDLDNDLFTNANSDGFDIRFVEEDDSTLLNHELVHYDSIGEEIVVWVQLPNVYENQETTFYIYYGNSTLTTDTSTTDTWDSNFRAVLHFEEDDPSTQELGDSTSFAHNFTNNNMESTDDVDGIVGGAYHYGGGDEYSQNDDVVSFESTLVNNYPFTYSTWIRTNSSDGAIIYAGDSGTGTDWSSIFVESGTGEVLGYSRSGGTSPPPTGVNDILDSNTVVNDWNWYKIDMVFTASDDKELFIDGVSVANSTTDVGKRSYNRVAIAAFRDISPSAYANAYYDEFRISDVARSTDWLKTEYANVDNASFIVSQGEEMNMTNTAPTITNHNIYYNGSHLVGEADVSDADGNLDSVNYTWWLDDVFYSEVQNITPVNASGNYTQQIWARDTMNVSTFSNESKFLDIFPPIIQDHVVSFNGTTLFDNANVTNDVGIDTVQYFWFKDDVLISMDQNYTLTDSDNATYVSMINATDLANLTSVSNDSFVVELYSPVFNSHSLSNNGTHIVSTYDIESPQGTDVVFVDYWFVNGVNVFSSADAILVTNCTEGASCLVIHQIDAQDDFYSFITSNNATYATEDVVTIGVQLTDLGTGTGNFVGSITAPVVNLTVVLQLVVALAGLFGAVMLFASPGGKK